MFKRQQACKKNVKDDKHFFALVQYKHVNTLFRNGQTDMPGKKKKHHTII